MDLQQPLFGLGRHRVDGANVVQQGRCVAQRFDSRLQTRGHFFTRVQDLQNRLFDGIDSHLELLVALQWHLLGYLDHLGEELTVLIYLEIIHLNTFETLKNGHHRIFAHLRNRYDLYHVSQRAQRVQIFAFGIGLVVIFLCQQNNRPVFFVRRLNQFETVFLRHRDRQQNPRKQHRVLDR